MRVKEVQVAALFVVLFPFGLLLFLLFMEKVEAPLRRSNDPQEVERFLDHAKQEDVDNIIAGGLRKAMDRWRGRITRRKSQPDNE